MEGCVCNSELDYNASNLQTFDAQRVERLLLKVCTCTLPFAATSSFLVSADQRPLATKSESKC
jgi:hypothetical protein